MNRLVVLFMGVLVFHASAQREVRSVGKGSEEVVLPYRSSTRFIPPVRKPEPNYDIRSTKETELPGRKVRIHQIDLPERVPVPEAQRVVPEVPQLTPEEIAEIEANYRPGIFTSLSATVVDRKATFLRWSYRGESFYAWSSIDFNFIRGVGRFEIDDQSYSLFMGIGETTEDRLEDWVGKPPRFRGKQPQFQVVSDNDPGPDALHVVEAIHKLYASKEKELKQAYLDQQKANRERKEWERLNPKNTDTNFYLWQGPDGGVLEGPPANSGYTGDALRFQEAQKRKKDEKPTRQKHQTRRKL